MASAKGIKSSPPNEDGIGTAAAGETGAVWTPATIGDVAENDPAPVDGVDNVALQGVAGKAAYSSAGMTCLEVNPEIRAESAVCVAESRLSVL